MARVRGRRGMVGGRRRRSGRCLFAMLWLLACAVPVRAQDSAQAQAPGAAPSPARLRIVEHTADDGVDSGDNGSAAGLPVFRQIGAAASGPARPITVQYSANPGGGSSGAGSAPVPGNPNQVPANPGKGNPSLVPTNPNIPSSSSSGGAAPPANSSSPLQRAVVPDLVGKSLEQASQALAAAVPRLDVALPNPPRLEAQYNGQCEARPGVVLEQRPAAGTPLLQAGGTVYAVLAFAEERVRVPDLARMSRQQALDALQSARLCPGTIHSQQAEGAAGVVLRVSGPAPGTEVPAGTRIDLVVSGALPVPAPVSVPVQPQPASPPWVWFCAGGGAAAAVLALLWRLPRSRRPAATAAPRLGYAVVKGVGAARVRAGGAAPAGRGVQLRMLVPAPTMRIHYKGKSDGRDHA